METIAEGPFAGCQRLHFGGQLILYSTGKFDLTFRRSHTICDGEPIQSGSFGLGTGTYRLNGDELVLQNEFGRVTAELLRGHRIDENTERCPAVRLEWDGTMYQFVACDANLY